MKTIINRIRRRATLVVLAATLVIILPSRSDADVTINFLESSSGVTATYTGTLDLNSVTPVNALGGSIAGITPSIGQFSDAQSGNHDVYALAAGGPSNFGAGGVGIPDSGTTSGFRLEAGAGSFWVPQDFTSGALSGILSWLDASDSFASLGINAGSPLVWTVAGTTQTISMTFGAVVPEPSSITLIISMALMGAVVLRSRKRNVSQQHG